VLVLCARDRYVLQNDLWQSTGTEYPRSVKNLYTDKLLSITDIQRDLLVETNRPAFVYTVEQADIKRVDFGIVADFHRDLDSKIKRIDGYNNDFFCLFYNHWCYLFDCVVFSLPYPSEWKVVPTQLPTKSRRFTRSFSNRTNTFVLGRATVVTLLTCVPREPDRFQNIP